MRVVLWIAAFLAIFFFVNNAMAQEVVADECVQVGIMQPDEYIVTSVDSREQIALRLLAAMLASATYENVELSVLIADAFAMADLFEGA